MTQENQNIEGGEHIPSPETTIKPTTLERLTHVTPKIYCASLADYNNGHLYGDWINATQPAEAIYLQVQEMLANSPIAGAEEWAIHDYEGFGSLRLSEYESFDTVSHIARGITEYGLAYAHWATIVGVYNQETLAQFDDHYLGRWDSLADYAKHIVEDLNAGPETTAPDWLVPYIHVGYEELSTTMVTDLHIAKDREGVHLFQEPSSTVDDSASGST